MTHFITQLNSSSVFKTSQILHFCSDTHMAFDYVSDHHGRGGCGGDGSGADNNETIIMILRILKFFLIPFPSWELISEVVTGLVAARVACASESAEI